MRLTDLEPEPLLADIGSDRVARKDSFKGEAPEKARQALCAFADDLPNHRKAGVGVIGAQDDDGRLASLARRLGSPAASH